MIVFYLQELDSNAGGDILKEAMTTGLSRLENGSKIWDKTLSIRKLYLE